MLKSRNVRTMLFLLAVAFCYTFVCGNGGCVGGGGEPVTITVEGKVEDWEVTGLDSAVEKVAAPILDFGDTAVEAARDTLTDIVKSDDLSELWGVGAGNID